MVMESIPLGAVPGPMKTTLIIDDGRGLRWGELQLTPSWMKTRLLYLGGFRNSSDLEEFDEDFEYEKEFDEEEFDEEYDE